MSDEAPHVFGMTSPSGVLRFEMRPYTDDQADVVHNEWNDLIDMLCHCRAEHPGFSNADQLEFVARELERFLDGQADDDIRRAGMPLVGTLSRFAETLKEEENR
jgi:hypothetical protein